MNVLEEVSYEDLFFAESIDCIRESAYMYDDSEEAEEEDDDDDDGDDGRLVKDQEAPENEPSEEGEIEECSESPNQTEVCQFKHSSESDGSNETDHKKRSMDAETPPLPWKIQKLGQWGQRESEFGSNGESIVTYNQDDENKYLNQAFLHPQSTFGADINNAKSGKDSNNSTWKVQGSSGLELGAANDSIKQTKPSINNSVNYASLFVGNMPRAVDNERLTETFAQFGKINSAKVLTDHRTGLSRGCGFVNFQHVSDAAMAIAYMNGHRIDGCALTVRVARLPPPDRSHGSPLFGVGVTRIGRLGNKELYRTDASLYVCHLPISVDEVCLMDLFCPFGKVARAKVIRDHTTGISKGYGFVSFEYASDADMAQMVMNGYKMHGLKICVKTRGVNTETKPKKETKGASIYVKYLPQALGENYLTQLFSSFGKVTKVKLLRDLSTGISKGSAFVYFENPDDTTLAVKNMNGRLINGHMLAVREALPMPPRT